MLSTKVSHNVDIDGVKLKLNQFAQNFPHSFLSPVRHLTSPPELISMQRFLHCTALCTALPLHTVLDLTSLHIALHYSLHCALRQSKLNCTLHSATLCTAECTELNFTAHCTALFTAHYTGLKFTKYYTLHCKSLHSAHCLEQIYRNPLHCKQFH